MAVLINEYASEISNATVPVIARSALHAILPSADTQVLKSKICHG